MSTQKLYCGFKLTVNVEVLKLKIEDLRDNEKVGYMVRVFGFVFILLGACPGLGFSETRYEW
jgi:hypothetical protein